MLLYYITDRTAFPGNERSRRMRLLDKVAEAGASGVDYIQLREKDLSSRDLESLAQEAAHVLRNSRTETKELRTVLLINSRTDVALAAQAGGVHLRDRDVSADEVRSLWERSRDADALAAGSEQIPESRLSPSDPIIAVSCHSAQDAERAVANRASFAVFGPVFEKKDAPGVAPAGLEALRHACRAEIPVLALGGVTLKNAASCLQAGAAGIAAIRLFQDNDIATIVRKLRA